MVEFDKEIIAFIEATHRHHVRMLLVGGGAVNFHGYQRHSADIDFWIETSVENLAKLKRALAEFSITFHDYPREVYEKQQNISIKISPYNIELITNFNINKSFDDAEKDSILTYVDPYPLSKYNVINLEDLLTSKVKSNRSKDLLDVLELKSIHNL